ncbi:hypothetical protein CkaCkLH20_00169 [Colletotrichum karsti]|uniref:Uncharacterized protein n=1 Tax=Colletotrichum karsti TaxID=1095194 RepID=A0A9P6LQB6_9PEZI|nr:uncharacterized protein CkaCkLH20_00169 [Colletotrichum karsti]KAF9882133.1 hypothetical protein CkaCkLH20_00169 [Colletotrichum karsti]
MTTEAPHELRAVGNTSTEDASSIDIEKTAAQGGPQQQSTRRSKIGVCFDISRVVVIILLLVLFAFVTATAVGHIMDARAARQ